MEKLNPTKHHKTSEEYAQLGLGKHYSSEEVKEQRDNMRESWADIMERRGIEKIVI